jgi:hypothetical protein
VNVRSNLLFGVLLIAAVSSPACAETREIPDCYDAVVVAKIMRQTPSVFPDSKDGYIIMVWPWFLKLEVRRAVSGAVPNGPLVVQSMQHTSFRKNLGSQRWWLRRNSLGGYNLLRFAESERLSKCSADGHLAEPYIRPGPGQTIDSLLSDGERAYRARP